MESSHSWLEEGKGCRGEHQEVDEDVVDQVAETGKLGEFELMVHSEEQIAVCACIQLR